MRQVIYDISKLQIAQAERGYTNLELAKRAKLSEATIRRMYRIGSAHPGSVKCVAKALGFELRELVIRQRKSA